MSNSILKLLGGGDLRSIGGVNKAVALIKDQIGFDQLFAGLWSDDRLLVMRVADAMEKISRKRPEFLQPHADALRARMNSAVNKELKWHLAQMASRVKWSRNEVEAVCLSLRHWITNPQEGRIVRVWALQALHDLAEKYPEMCRHFQEALALIKDDPAPSIQARVRRMAVDDK